MVNLIQIATAANQLADQLDSNTITLTAARLTARQLRLALRSAAPNRLCPAATSCFHSLCNAHAYLRLTDPTDAPTDLRETASLLTD